MTITLTKRVRHHHVAYQQQRPTGFLWNPSVSRNLCKLGVSVFLQNGHLWLFNNGSTFNGLFMIMFHYMGEVYVYFTNWNLALHVPFCEHLFYHFVFVVTTRNQKTKKKKKTKTKGQVALYVKKNVNYKHYLCCVSETKSLITIGENHYFTCSFRSKLISIRLKIFQFHKLYHVKNSLIFKIWTML